MPRSSLRTPSEYLRSTVRASAPQLSRAPSSFRIERHRRDDTYTHDPGHAVAHRRTHRRPRWSLFRRKRSQQPNPRQPSIGTSETAIAQRLQRDFLHESFRSTPTTSHRCRDGGALQERHRPSPPDRRRSGTRNNASAALITRGMAEMTVSPPPAEPTETLSGLPVSETSSSPAPAPSHAPVPSASSWARAANCRRPRPRSMASS